MKEQWVYPCYKTSKKKITNLIQEFAVNEYGLGQQRNEYFVDEIFFKNGEKLSLKL